MLRSIYRLCFGIVLAGLASTSMAKPTINILSWWGYFENQELLELIENECEVEISVDNYYSSGEFIRRLRSAKNGYDIVVFSNTIYNVVRDDILRKEAILINEVVQDYNDVVKEQYNQCDYPSNVCYFTHGVTGFLWNTENIKISENDRLKTIFENAGEQTVVLIDDEVELTELVMKGIEENINTREDFLKMTQEDFRSLTKKSKIVVNNDIETVKNIDSFAFAFAWSGASLVSLKDEHPKVPLAFTVHPELSYISTDLLGALNNKKETLSVAKLLLGEKASALIENKSNYFTPRFKANNIQNSHFKKIYADVVKKLPNLNWLDQVSYEEFALLEQKWKEIKLKLNI